MLLEAIRWLIGQPSIGSGLLLLQLLVPETPITIKDIATVCWGPELNSKTLLLKRLQALAVVHFKK